MLKKIKIIIPAIILILTIIPFVIQDKKDVFSNFINVDNSYGIKTKLLEIRNKKFVYIKCKFKNCGTLWDAKNQHGLAGVCAALMFKKIGTLLKEETSEKLLTTGIKNLKVNANSDDYVISFYVNKNQINEALLFLSNGFREITFSKNDLEYVKTKLPYILNADTSHPSELLMEGLTHLMYGDQKYGLNVTGSAADIAHINENDVKKFVKEKITKNNLEIIFIGDVSWFNINEYLKNLVSTLPSGAKIANPQKISAQIHNKKTLEIFNRNMKNIVGVVFGFRCDHLRDLEKAAIYTLFDTLFDEKIGDFNLGIRELNIGHNAYYCKIERTQSVAFCVLMYIQKDDLKKYLDYIHQTIDRYSKTLNLKQLQLTQNYLIKNKALGFTDTNDLDDAMADRFLPYERVDNLLFSTISKKIFNPNLVKIVVIRAPEDI